MDNSQLVEQRQYVATAGRVVGVKVGMALLSNPSLRSGLADAFSGYFIYRLRVSGYLIYRLLFAVVVAGRAAFAFAYRSP